MDDLVLHAISVAQTSDDDMREQLMAQLETCGFLVLTDIPGYDEKRYLKACKALHQLPLETKRKLYLQKDNPENPNTYRGYQPFQPNDASHKEFLDQGFPFKGMSDDEKQYPLYEKTPFPEGEDVKWIAEEFENTYNLWYALALNVIRLLVQGLGKPADFFDPWFIDGSLTTFRTIHYEPRSKSGVDSSKLSEEECRLTTPEHTDSGFLTFLATFGYPGLQVKFQGEYRSVAPVENTLIVNIGSLFSDISNGRLKATEHRVLDIGVERYSSPMFLEPKYSAQIAGDLLASNRTSVTENMPKDKPFFGDYVMKRITKLYVEWKDFEIPESRRKYIDAINLDDL